MRTTVYKTAELGELVVAAFDEAAHHSANPREISRLATGAVMDMVRRSRKTSHAPRHLPSRHGGSA